MRRCLNSNLDHVIRSTTSPPIHSIYFFSLLGRAFLTDSELDAVLFTSSTFNTLHSCEHATTSIESRSSQYL